MIIEERDLKEGELPINKIVHGNVLDILKKLPSGSVDLIVTSPPYWGLRDYGEEVNVIWDGDPNCEHVFELKHVYREPSKTGEISEKAKIGQGYRNYKSGFCKKCGAWYGQLGLEPTLELYLEHMLQITAELKRVLKKTGVMFWNHGSNYHDKDDTMQNYELVMRMRKEQGWILRNVIVWHKPNHMPSSVKDRFANAYEPVFMLTKGKKYWFDLDAVRVPSKTGNGISQGIAKGKRFGGNAQPTIPVSGFGERELKNHPLGKNPGDVWQIPTQPFPEAHFATFPERLVEPMIKAGCPKWICKKCGKARERIIEKGESMWKYTLVTNEHRPKENDGFNHSSKVDGKTISGKLYFEWKLKHPDKFLGWTDCGCKAGWEPGIVLDPFLGSGTTAVVARKNGCNFVGVEINMKYCNMAEKRILPYLKQKNLMEVI